MSDLENQIFVPPSFIALYSDARGRLRERPALVRERYELCEDLAGHLVGQAQTLYQLQVPSEFEVLRRDSKGIVDIITYDDLLARLQAVLDQLRSGPALSAAPVTLQAE